MLEKMQTLTKETDAGLLTTLLEMAAADIKSYCGLDAVPTPLESAQLELAIILYNRMGMEGEMVRSEGGVSRTVESGIPMYIRGTLNRYRKVRLVGL